MLYKAVFKLISSTFTFISRPVELQYAALLAKLQSNMIKAKTRKTVNKSTPCGCQMLGGKSLIFSET